MRDMSVDTLLRSVPFERDLLTVNQAMALGYGARSTLSEWAKNGQIKKYKIGKGVRYKKSELDAMVVELPSQTNADETIKQWAERIAATAPPMDDDQAAMVVAILRGGASS